jgi:hypothetical protein
VRQLAVFQSRVSRLRYTQLGVFGAVIQADEVIASIPLVAPQPATEYVNDWDREVRAPTQYDARAVRLEQRV